MNPQGHTGTGSSSGIRAIACIGLHALVGSLAASAEGARDLEIVSAYTIVGQTSDDSSLRDNITASLDLYLNWSGAGGRFEVYFEGNNSLRDDGVATRIPRSNADAGTALDPDRSGRVQLSEAKYRYTWEGERSISGGLIDPSLSLDATRINNDENLQFLGASFVNNPTIEFPDYSLGVAAHLPGGDGRPNWNLVLTGSNGIADNPNVSYSQLLNVTDGHKGIFAGAEAVWSFNRHLLRAGSWVNTAEHETLDGFQHDAANYGIYAAAGTSREGLAANLRLGVANPDVSLADRFASLSLQWDRGKRVFGIAAAHTWISSEVTPVGPDHNDHLEGYVRFELAKDLYLTPSVQYLTHGGFDSQALRLDDDAMIYSLRLHHVFAQHPRSPASEAPR